MTNSKENSIVESGKKDSKKSTTKKPTAKKATTKNPSAKKGAVNKMTEENNKQPEIVNENKEQELVVAEEKTVPVETNQDTPQVEEMTSEIVSEEPSMDEMIIDDIETAPVVKLKRTTRLDSYKREYTIKKLYKMRDKLNFDLAIQRGEVWTLMQKSNLIHSILYGFPIPQVMVEDKGDDGVLHFLDGKQRLTSIIGFLNGEYALSKSTPNVMGEKIAGQKFADLKEEFQDYINDEVINILVIKNLTDVEREELFSRWNAGSPLAKIEKIRALYSGLFKQIDDEIRDENFFSDDIPLSTTARDRFKDVEMILHIAMLISGPLEDFKGFGSPQIEKFVLNLKAQDALLPKKLIEKMRTISTYLTMAFSDWGKTSKQEALKRTHVPIIFYTAMKAKSDRLKPEQFAEFIRVFLITNYSINSVYGRSCQNGAPKKESVLTRIREMDKAYDQFLSLIRQNSSNPQNGVNEFEKVTTPTSEEPKIEEETVEAEITK